MTYENLLETIVAIVDNDKIYKEGLTLHYELDEENHRKMDEHLFYANPQNNAGATFSHSDIIEVEMDGIIVKITKK